MGEPHAADAGGAEPDAADAGYDDDAANADGHAGTKPDGHAGLAGHAAAVIRIDFKFQNGLVLGSQNLISMGGGQN